MACVSAAHCGAVSLVLYSDPRPTDPSAASGLGSSERSRASRPVSAGLGRSRPVSSGLEGPPEPLWGGFATLESVGSSQHQGQAVTYMHMDMDMDMQE